MMPTDFISNLGILLDFFLSNAFWEYVIEIYLKRAIYNANTMECFIATFPV